MFRVAASVLKDFATRKHMGELGFTAVLHTHSRQRALHPHLHIIVASGGYDSANNSWIKGKSKYLFNAFALASVWRARMLDVIKHHDMLTLTHKQSVSIPKKWVVDCRKVGYGLPALQYLSRYLYRGVLPDKDIVKTTDTAVTFKYKDGQTQKTCYKTLPTLEFLWLILQHILPKGLQRVRDYGFLRGNAKKLLWKIMLVLMSTQNWVAPKPKTINRKAKRLCPCCNHVNEMQCVGVTRTSEGRE